MSGGVGLVGAGRVASLHVAALRALGVPLIGVVSSTPARSASAARRWGAEDVFDDLASMLRDPRIDTVHITTPSAMHAAQVEQALRAGKHVVCEKPLSTTASDAERLTALAAASGLIGAVAYTYRFHPVAAALRERVRGMGALLLVRAAYLQEWLLDAEPTEWRLDPARNGASLVIADVGSHLVDLIEYVTGTRVTAVSAVVRALDSHAERGAVDDHAVVSFELDGGAVGSLDVSQVAVGHENTLALELFGVEGSAALDLRDRTHVWQAHRGAAASHVRVPGIGTAPTGTDADYMVAYIAFLRAMRAVVGGAASDGLPVFADCLRTQRVRDAIHVAARERRWVDVSTLPESSIDVTPADRIEVMTS